MHIVLPHVQIAFFKIPQLWQSGFSRVYSNCCCSCWFEPKIIKISQSSHNMYSNNILIFQESTTILNACTKKSGNLLKIPRINIYSHPQTDCFVLSELFSVARPAERSKPGSKPVQHYVRQSFGRVGHQADYVGSGNFKVFYF